MICERCGLAPALHAPSKFCWACGRLRRKQQLREATNRWRHAHPDRVREMREVRTVREAALRIALYGVRKPGPKRKEAP